MKLLILLLSVSIAYASDFSVVDVKCNDSENSTQFELVVKASTPVAWVSEAYVSQADKEYSIKGISRPHFPNDGKKFDSLVYENKEAQFSLNLILSEDVSKQPVAHSFGVYNYRGEEVKVVCQIFDNEPSI